MELINQISIEELFDRGAHEYNNCEHAQYGTQGHENALDSRNDQAIRIAPFVCQSTSGERNAYRHSHSAQNSASSKYDKKPTQECWGRIAISNLIECARDNCDAHCQMKKRKHGKQG
jgi:hypothetical protein